MSPHDTARRPRLAALAAALLVLAAVPAPNAESADPAALQQVRDALADMESLLAAGRADDVLRRVDALQSPAARSYRADLYYWQGRALLDARTGLDGEPARTAARRAGLAFMRVVIHFPGHALAPECLHRSARLSLDGGMTDAARRLWMELLRTYPSAHPWAEDARRELARLNGAAR